MYCENWLWSAEGSIVGPLLFLLYGNDMKQAVDCDLFLYDSCVSVQRRGRNSKTK